VTVFLDTGYFVAFLVPRDQWFQKAVHAAQTDFRAVTSSLVVNETVSLLQARGLLSTALAWLSGIRADPKTLIIYVDASMQVEGWSLFHRYAGSGANAIDCTSFAVMRSLSIKQAFTFDQHFRAAGFEILA
jgi:predicted nucleic acid-binding protein